MVRLDNMLIAEGVAGPERVNTPETGDQADYKQKLIQIRQTYNDEMRKYNDVSLIYKILAYTLFDFWGNLISFSFQGHKND